MKHDTPTPMRLKYIPFSEARGKTVSNTWVDSESVVVSFTDGTYARCVTETDYDGGEDLGGCPYKDYEDIPPDVCVGFGFLTPEEAASEQLKRETALKNHERMRDIQTLERLREKYGLTQ